MKRIAVSGLAVLALSVMIWAILDPSNSDEISEPGSEPQVGADLETAQFHPAEAIREQAADEGGEALAAERQAVEELETLPSATSDEAEVVKTVRGRVVVDGIGLAGASVQVHDIQLTHSFGRVEIPQPLHTVECDAGGRFEFLSTRPEFCLVPTHADFLAKDLVAVDDEAPQTIEEMDLEIFAKQTLTGEVLSDGAPIADALVNVMLLDHWERNRHGDIWGVSYKAFFTLRLQSDQQGGFQFEAPAGKLEVGANKVGYNRPRLRSVDASDSPLLLQLKRDEPKGKYFNGFVQDPSGQPVAAASVRPMPGGEEVKSGLDGEFRIGPLEKQWGYNQFVAAWNEGFAPGFVELDLEGSDNIVIVQLRQGLSISGRLLDAEGKPLAGKRVRADGEANQEFPDNSSQPPMLLQVFPGNGANLNWAKTNEQGEFQFTDLPVGEYRITYEPGSNLWGPSEKVEALAMANAGDQSVVLTVGDMQGLEVSISGTVTDFNTGQTIANAEISLNLVRDMGDSGWSASGIEFVTADQNGKYLIGGLMEGDYYLNCKAQGFAQRKSERQIYAPGQHVVNFALSEERRVDLTVVDVRGEAVPDGQVTVKNSDGQNLMISTSPTSSRSPANLDEDGKLTMYKMPAEVLTLNLTAGWGLELTSREIDLRSPGPHQVNIRLEQAVHEKTQSVRLNFHDAEEAVEVGISSNQNRGLVVRAYDANNHLVDSKVVWRDGDKWKRLKFGEPLELSPGHISVRLPLSGGRIEIDADGFQSRSMMVETAEVDFPRQTINVELIP